MFTRGFKKPDIQTFLNHLIETSRKPECRLRILSSVRSEFLPQLEEVNSVLQLLNTGSTYHLGPLSPVAIADMITKPAKATGYGFEPGLVKKILKDAAQEPGNLPLVAYTLKQLFEGREGNVFTHAAYLALGGVAGAIGTKADQVMECLPAETKEAFDRVFAELVHIEGDGPPTRKRVPLSRFKNDAEASALIDALAGQDCRVLVTDSNELGAMIEVAHEKLFSAWPHSQKWIEDCGEALRFIEYAEEAARQWETMGSHVRDLWQKNWADKLQETLNRFEINPSVTLGRRLHPQPVLIEKLVNYALSHEDRFLIGKKLAEFGDPRPGVGLREDGLPDIVWIEIDGGQIQLEDMDHVFEVKPFLLAKYPVTNAQFEAFLKAEDGYFNKDWWEKLEQPEGPALSSWNEANCPRETVSWNEAVAFCRWLRHRTELTIRLPAEWEWQHSATGGDSSYKYPWGKEWDPSCCNSLKAVLYRTNPVGIYPEGATKQGVMDMAGNVCEWCSNLTDEPDAFDRAAEFEPVRGGCWFEDTEMLWSSKRDFYISNKRANGVGFRLAQDPP